MRFSTTVANMGNEESHYPNIDIEDEAVEVTDNWSLHYAKGLDDNVHIHSAFISQPKGSLTNVTPLERLSKNLMIHRHPCIVKYISSWSKNNRLYLITEEVKPLPLILKNQSALQICIGLHSVLTALVFLHEKAQSSHNNICCASIYVTAEGIWKLGGLEYLKKFTDVTPSYLQESRTNRYERAVPPEEDSLPPNSKVNAEAIDKYAFGILVEELLKKKTADEIPCLLTFRDYCKKQLQHSDPDERVSLSEVLSHQFFNHDFIRISRFLFDLPLKMSHEKEQFFSDLTEQLYLLPEDVVGSQLASLLLSRVVLLDSTAQKHLLPVVLQPRIEEKQNGVALFSEDVFKKHVVPKLLQIFCVRDAQIRLILLNHFCLFCNMFTMEQLRHQVLPELLVGIKDVNDQIVSMTLKALSQLVMILGATTVIGGKRGKVFTDGRPKSQSSAPSAEGKAKSKDRHRQSPIKASPEILFGESTLPERPSPDGGEDNSSSSTVGEGEGDTENWSDWDSPGDKESWKVTNESTTAVPVAAETTQSEPPRMTGSVILPVNKRLPDITSLDIKSNAKPDLKVANGGIGSGSNGGEVDFFHDMEPVISKTQVLSINSGKTKFDVDLDEVGNDGWGEDWGEEEEEEEEGGGNA